MTALGAEVGTKVEAGGSGRLRRIDRGRSPRPEILYPVPDVSPQRRTGYKISGPRTTASGMNGTETSHPGGSPEQLRSRSGSPRLNLRGTLNHSRKELRRAGQGGRTDF